MNKNVGKLDKFIRIVIAIIAFVAYFMGYVNGTIAYISLFVGIIMLLTAVINFCPLYKILGLNSCNKCKKED